MKIRLDYGKKGLDVKFPDRGVTVVEPRFIQGLPDPEESLRNSLRNPVDSAPLSELVKIEDKVAISICDSTRAMPSGTVLTVILQELNHMPDDNIRILVATGTHRPSTRKELEEIVGAEILDRYKVINHVCTDEDSLLFLGKTASGIPVKLNRAWAESDIRITTGFVEPHFFAGFSGGPKLVAPGLAGLETVMALHSAALIASEKSTWGIIEENPLHTAVREISEMTGVHFSLDVTLNSRHEITSVQAGDLFAVHKKARAFTKAAAMQEVDNLFDLVVTTNSGYPLDLNLYQTVKGLSGAARVVKPGGVIICASECSDGIPANTDFAEMLFAMKRPGQFLQQVSEPGFRRQDQWQVQVLAQVLTKAKVYLKSGGLSDEEIRACHLFPAAVIEDRISAILEKNPNAKICVLPEGPQTIPYLRE
jgi:lactate racemase